MVPPAEDRIRRELYHFENFSHQDSSMNRAPRLLLLLIIKFLIESQVIGAVASEQTRKRIMFWEHTLLSQGCPPAG